MKRLLIVMSALLTSFSMCHAQDIITTREGEDIESKVIAVNPGDIQYKKYNNLDGPTYTILKSEVFQIRYENGDKDVFSAEEATSMYTKPEGVSIVPGMKYREYKNMYNAKEYVPSGFDPYSRGWAGVASFFIPGLGQAIEGEWGRAAGFFLGNLGLNLAMYASIGINVDEYGDYVGTGIAPLTFFATNLALNIWSICDAVHVAKIKNMYIQDLRGQNASVSLDFAPYLSYTPTGLTYGEPVAGMSMRISF